MFVPVGYRLRSHPEEQTLDEATRLKPGFDSLPSAPVDHHISVELRRQSRKAVEVPLGCTRRVILEPTEMRVWPGRLEVEILNTHWPEQMIGDDDAQNVCSTAIVQVEYQALGQPADLLYQQPRASGVGAVQGVSLDFQGTPGGEQTMN